MKCYYPIDSAGNRIGFKTPEACVYDASGTSLTTKLAQINSKISNVDNTADANKSVKYATTAGSANTAGTADSAKIVASYGNYTPVPSDGTADDPTSGMPTAELGMFMTQSYNNVTPAQYGNIINVSGKGTGQLFMEWSGTDNELGRLYYRSHRDNVSGWSDWGTVAYIEDIFNILKSYHLIR